MYQGKFDAKSRGQKAPEQTLQSILEERNAAKAAASKPKVTRTPAKTVKPAPQPQVAPKVQPAPAPKQVPQAEPVEKKKGPRLGSVIFYTIYFLFIFAFFAGMFFVLQWLQGWLSDYEAAQPTIKCQEVFNDLFGNPDWEKLYLDAGVQDTEFEGVKQYATYMREKVGNKKLDFVETSAGLSGDKKYIVRLDNEKIATFTLEGKSESITDIPDWKEGKVELFFQRQQSYRIQKMDGHITYVNGRELSDDYTVQIVTTKVEKFLPVGTIGPRVCTQEIDNLLCKPEVKITNDAGVEMEVIYDEETRTFAEPTVASAAPDEAKELALGALRAYAEFMINASGSRAAVNKYFDGASKVYSDIVKMAGELWMNHDYGHSFKDESVTNYVRFNDELFSVRASVTMHATLKDNSYRDYTVDQALFFMKKNGKWVCYEMTNEDVNQPVGKVRLTFVNDGVVLSNEFYETDCTELRTPVITVPEGKVLSGWMREDVNEDGHKSMTLVFTPDEDGVVRLGAGVVLEPMVLYPLIENAAEGAN